MQAIQEMRVMADLILPGGAIQIPVEVTYVIHPNIPGNSTSPAERASCEIKTAQMKIGDQWVGATHVLSKEQLDEIKENIEIHSADMVAA